MNDFIKVIKDAAELKIALKDGKLACKNPALTIEAFCARVIMMTRSLSESYKLSATAALLSMMSCPPYE